MAQKSKERQSWSDSLSQDLQRDSKEMKGNQGSTEMSRMRLANVLELWLMKKKKSLQRLNSSGKDLFLTLSQVLFLDAQNHQDINLLNQFNKKYLITWKYKFSLINVLSFSLAQLLLEQIKRILDQNLSLMELLPTSTSRKMREERLLL